MSTNRYSFFANPFIGSLLAVVGGISFFFTCMMLPLVGRSGNSVPYADANQSAFLGAVGVTFILGALASGSKLARRAQDQSPLPVWSLGLCVVCVALVGLQLAGLLAI